MEEVSEREESEGQDCGLRSDSRRQDNKRRACLFVKMSISSAVVIMQSGDRILQEIETTLGSVASDTGGD